MYSENYRMKIKKKFFFFFFFFFITHKSKRHFNLRMRQRNFCKSLHVAAAYEQLEKRTSGSLLPCHSVNSI